MVSTRIDVGVYLSIWVWSEHILPVFDLIIKKYEIAYKSERKNERTEEKTYLDLIGLTKKEMENLRNKSLWSR